MKRILIPVILILVLFSSCLKESVCRYDACSVVAPASEIQTVQSYLTTNGITATQHCSGLFYKIDNAGTGKTPDVCHSITVTYTGQLTNGTVFDQQNSPVSIPLGNVILGWKNGIPQLKEGGHIHLYIPPSLGYGNQQAGSIPPNSNLIFDIILVAVQ